MHDYSRIFIQHFLKNTRELVASNSMPARRLPKWTRAALVRTGRLNNTHLFLLQDAIGDDDVFLDSGDVKSDLQFFLRLPGRIPRKASLKAPEGRGLIMLVGEYGIKERVIFDIQASSGETAFFNVGYVDYHSPISLVNTCLRLNVANDCVGVCFVPFSLYVHNLDFVDEFASFWSKCEKMMRDTLMGLCNSPAGDYYELTAQTKPVFTASKENSVIVFGKYTGSEMNELLQVRDYLIGMRYDAHLLREFPEHPSMSLEEKARLWSSATRFSVMIDREPSGALVEFPYLKNGRVILALLRQKGKPSTLMIGDEPAVDLNYIRVFEFENSPLEVIDNAIAWAEKIVKKRVEAYSALYPWRRG